MDTSKKQLKRRTVLIGQYGSVLDRRGKSKRWDRWRPSIDVCRHDDLLIERFELLVEPKFRMNAEELVRDIALVSPETEIHIHEVKFKDPWDFAEVYSSLRTLFDRFEFDEEREDYLAHITTGTHVFQICLFLLAETRFLPARLLQSSPPKKGRQDPGTFSIIDLDLSRYDELSTRFAEEKRAGVSFLKAGIATKNEAFNHLMERIEYVCLHSDTPILLTGPTGVGKTRLARRIHELKSRSGRLRGSAFVELNCATIRGDSAMSTLFGHEKGAFTGALAKRDGLLLAANNGLLFLDEIGELGLDEQAMLLRALEDGLFQPLGSDRTASSSFQLIAGTNRDLAAAVRKGTFREDLLARIDLWSFELPSLRDRREDIEPNLEFELERLSRDFGRAVRFNKEGRARFLDFASAPSSTWRANFRDLASAMTRMATLSSGGRISSDVVDEEIERLERDWRRLDGGASNYSIVDEILGEDRAAELDLFDRAQLAEVLSVCRRSRSLSEAGRTLFAESLKKKSSKNDASRLAKYLAKFDLTWAAITI